MSYIGNAIPSATTLGGTLDVNGNKIISNSSGDIDIEPHGTGNVLLGNLKFDADQTVSSSEDNYVLTYNDSAGTIGLEAASGGGNPSGTNITLSTASYPGTPSSGQAFIYTSQTSGNTGIRLHASGSSEVLEVLSGSSGTVLFKVNNQGNCTMAGGLDASNLTSGSYIVSPSNSNDSVRVAGNILLKGTSKKVQFYEGSNYVGFQGPATLSGDQMWVLPSVDGQNGEFLKTDGAGNLSWGAASGGGGSSSSISPNLITVARTGAGSQSRPAQPTQGNATLYTDAATTNAGLIIETNTNYQYACKFVHGTSGGLDSAGGRVRINAMGNAEFHYHVEAQYFTGLDAGDGSYNPSGGYGETGNGLSLPGAIIMEGSSDHNEYAKPIVMHYDSGSNDWVKIRPSTSTTSQYDFTLPPDAGSSSGLQLQTNGSGTTSWASASSDIRLKKNIEDNILGLDFINDLNTIKFEFKSFEEIWKDEPQFTHYKPNKHQTEQDAIEKEGTQLSLIAQELKDVIEKHGSKDFKGHVTNKHGIEEVRKEEFIFPLIKAVQELSKRVEELEEELKK